LIKSGKLVLVVVLTAFLGGCGVLPSSSDVKAKEAEVTEWNNLTQSTLDAYKKAKNFAESNKADMLNYVIRGKNWSGHTGLVPLTEEQLKDFKVNAIVHDKYFTALGATSVREVLVINGNYRRMFVTVIWGNDKVQSVDRVVVDL
jgi:hypothetical protein